MNEKSVEELRKKYGNEMIKLKTEAGKEISLKELNFEKRIIGSDEAGLGEIFRPLITVAAYVNPENIDRLIGEEVKDSKSYGDNYEEAKKEVYRIAEKLTGFVSYKDFEGKEGQVISTEYVTFAANALLNDKFNREYKPRVSNKKPSNLHDLQIGEHNIVLKKLAEDVSYDYIVIDDFQQGFHHNKIIDELRGIDGIDELRRMDGMDKSDEVDILDRHTVIAVKADAKIMAVACASVIAYYLTNLYLDALDEELKSKYKISIQLPRGAWNTGDFPVFLKMLKGVLKEEYKAFLEKYANKYYIKMELDDD